MSDAQLTMDDVNAMRLCLEDMRRQFMDDTPTSPLVVFHPSMAIDLARELDKTGIAFVRRQEDGVYLVETVDVYEGPTRELTQDQLGLLAWSRGMRFIVMANLCEPRPVPRRDPKAHMAELRRKTGQDWRGRR